MADPEKKKSLHPFIPPALGIFFALAVLLVLMLMSDRQYGPGKAFLNQPEGDVFDYDPGWRGRDAGEPPQATRASTATDDDLAYYDLLSRALGAAKSVAPASDAAACTTQCDCEQGQTCSPDVGLCVDGPVSIYCCTKTGCPAGEICANPDGTGGRCPAP